jgi:hypothetical protein
MALIQKLGIELQYCPDFEAALREGHGGNNDFYYEDARLTHRKIAPPEGGNKKEEIWFEGKAIKMFSHVVTHNVQHVPPQLAANVKVIWMYRDASKIEQSIRKYKKPQVKYTVPGGIGLGSTVEQDLVVVDQLEDLYQEAVQKIPNLLTVEFENLLKDPVGVAKVVADFLERPLDSSMVDEFLKVIRKDKTPAEAVSENDLGNGGIDAMLNQDPAISCMVR